MLLAVGFFVAVIALEVPRMLKSGLYRELKVFTVLVFLAMAGAYAALLDLPMPSVTAGLDVVFRPVFLVMEAWLGAPE